MSKYAQHALAKLNEDRLGKQTFCDYFIKTETQEFPVHKCLLGVMSDFFRGMFETEMTEKYQNFWDSKEFQSEIIDAILNFLYGKPNSITPENVYRIVEAADYMQIPKLLEYCGKLSSSNLTEKNLFQNWQHAKQYRLENLIDMCRNFAAEHFLALSRCIEVLSLELVFFEEFLQTRSCTAMEERVYETIISWINFDRENRSTYFGKLFDKIDLDQIPKSFINIEISNNELVLDNPVASKKLLRAMRKHLMFGASGQEHESQSSFQVTQETNKTTGRDGFVASHRGASLSDHLETNKENLENRNICKLQSSQENFNLQLHAPKAITPPEDKNESLQSPTNSQTKSMTASGVMPYQIYSSNATQISSASSGNIVPASVSQQVLASDQTFTARGKMMLEQIELGKHFSPISASQTASPDQTVSSTSSSALDVHQSVTVQPQQSSEIVLIGGTTSPTYARKYNVETKQCTRLADIKGVCIDGRAARIENFLYYLGGKSLKKKATSQSSVWKLNVANTSDDGWESRKEMSQKRQKFGCVVFQKQIYVVGGCGDKTKFLSSAESYNPHTNNWKKEPNMNLVRVGCELVAYKKKLIVIGGLIQREPKSYSNTVEMLSGKQWVFSGTGLNEARSDFAAVVFDNRIFVIGGIRYGTHLSSVEMFCKKKWTTTTSMISPRSGHSACVIGSKIYVAGGKNEKGPLKSIEVFTPELNKWEVLSGEIKGDSVGIAIVKI